MEFPYLFKEFSVSQGFKSANLKLYDQYFSYQDITYNWIDLMKIIVNKTQITFKFKDKEIKFDGKENFQEILTCIKEILSRTFPQNKLKNITITENSNAVVLTSNTNVISALSRFYDLIAQKQLETAFEPFQCIARFSFQYVSLSELFQDSEAIMSDFLDSAYLLPKLQILNIEPQSQHRKSKKPDIWDNIKYFLRNSRIEQFIINYQIDRKFSDNIINMFASFQFTGITFYHTKFDSPNSTTTRTRRKPEEAGGNQAKVEKKDPLVTLLEQIPNKKPALRSIGFNDAMTSQKLCELLPNGVFKDIIKLDLSETVIGVSDIDTILSSISQVIILKLSNCSLNLGYFFDALGRSLDKLPKLRILDVSKNHFLDTLTQNSLNSTLPRLTHLIVSSVDFGNDNFSKFLKFVFKRIPQGFSFNISRATSTQDLSNEMKEVVSKESRKNLMLQNLKEIKWRGLPIDESFITFLSLCKNLESLDIGGCFKDDTTLKLFSGGKKKNPISKVLNNLKSLSLSDDDSIFLPLVTQAQNQNYMSGNYQQIFDMISEFCKSLTFLDISGNQIKDQGVFSLPAFIQKIETLQDFVFDLQGISQISTLKTFAASFVSIPKRPRISFPYKDFCGLNKSEENLDEFFNSWRFLGQDITNPLIPASQTNQTPANQAPIQGTQAGQAPQPAQTAQKTQKTTKTQKSQKTTKTQIQDNNAINPVTTFFEMPFEIYYYQPNLDLYPSISPKTASVLINALPPVYGDEPEENEFIPPNISPGVQKQDVQNQGAQKQDNPNPNQEPLKPLNPKQDNAAKKQVPQKQDNQAQKQKHDHTKDKSHSHRKHVSESSESETQSDDDSEKNNSDSDSEEGSDSDTDEEYDSKSETESETDSDSDHRKKKKKKVFKLETYRSDERSKREKAKNNNEKLLKVFGDTEEHVKKGSKLHKRAPKLEEEEKFEAKKRHSKKNLKKYESDSSEDDDDDDYERKKKKAVRQVAAPSLRDNDDDDDLSLEEEAETEDENEINTDVDWSFPLRYVPKPSDTNQIVTELNDKYSVGTLMKAVKHS